MKKVFWLIAAIFISLGAACAPQEKKMQYNISFLGDSITYGATLSEGELCFADLIARQASKRGGTLYCRRVGDRVKLAGKAVLYSEANLFV